MQLVRYNDSNSILTPFNHIFDDILWSRDTLPFTKTLFDTNFPYFKEENGAYSLEINLPGVKKDNLNVFIQEGQLHIEYENKKQKLSQSYSLPSQCEGQNVTARYEDGVLTVTTQKREIPKLKVRVD